MVNARQISSMFGRVVLKITFSLDIFSCHLKLCFRFYVSILPLLHQWCILSRLSNKNDYFIVLYWTLMIARIFLYTNLKMYLSWEYKFSMKFIASYWKIFGPGLVHGYCFRHLTMTRRTYLPHLQFQTRPQLQKKCSTSYGLLVPADVSSHPVSSW